MSTFQHINKPRSFFDLPGEIRNNIYRNVFKGAQITVLCRSNPRFARHNLDDEVEDMWLYTTLVVGCSRHLLLVCKGIRAEATPLLSAASDLIVLEHHERRSPINHIPDNYLLLIKRLEVDIDTFIWVPRERLPNLQQVTLTHTPPQDDQIMHMLECNHCGSQTYLLTVMVAEIQDWFWKRKQFVHIAEEENFSIEFVVKHTWDSGQVLVFEIDMKNPRLKGIQVHGPRSGFYLDPLTYGSLSRFRRDFLGLYWD